MVEHELEVVRRADWIVDVGPAAGEQGGENLYSGPLSGLKAVGNSQTARHLFARSYAKSRHLRKPSAWLKLVHRLINKRQDVVLALGRSARHQEDVDRLIDLELLTEETRTGLREAKAKIKP